MNSNYTNRVTVCPEASRQMSKLATASDNVVLAMNGQFGVRAERAFNRIRKEFNWWIDRSHLHRKQTEPSE